MGLFGKLFSKRIDPEAERIRQIFERAENDSKKPQGAYKMALFGAETRLRLFRLIEEVETEIGQTSVGIAQDVGVLMVHPKLTEAIQKQDDNGLLELALYLAFPTPDATRRLNEDWPSTVGKYRGQQNTEELLREKSFLLTTFIVYNLDIASTIYAQSNKNGPDLSDEQEICIKLEEAACWNCVVSELALRYIGEDRQLFTAYLQDNFANFLARQGASPDAICSIMADRIEEYFKYQKWMAEGEEGRGGTLMWEAAKHVGEPIGGSEDDFFLTAFGFYFVRRVYQALIYELLTGRNN